ncbi:DUF7619 domain-containing protein [Ferruginibacter albus]|uniref:DUF7619 domain-containing protein n=1 Tax=Ferruginibacter albus TaxID=2875540 RepID=UPI001CC5434E|nr:hypothetical protein [Ferruginibacter albus]UAY52021.1 hypothetical protein K9M53_15685 [Ferruginibacter albus]
MKKLLPLLACLTFLSMNSKAQYVDINDFGFRYFLEEKYPSCLNNDLMLDTTCIATIADSLIIDMEFRDIVESLDGLQYFKSLKYLDFSNCTNLTTIPAFPSSLQYLDLSQCPNLVIIPSLPSSLQHLNLSNASKQLAIPAFPSSLKYLDCSYNAINFLDILPDSLEYLNCSNQSGYYFDPYLGEGIYRTLSSLPTLPKTLKYLDCSVNAMEHLPQLPDSLIYLDCSGQDSLISLPALPAKLEYLICAGNYKLGNYLGGQGPGLPALPNSLTHLNCFGDNLTPLPTLPNNLKTLVCGGNLFTKLSALPNSLDSLDCSNGARLFTSLPQLPNTLKYLIVDNNNNLTCLPRLPDSLKVLSCSYTNISCLPNRPQHLTGTFTSTICNPANNTYHCQQFPSITGTVFYDNNSNGIKDANEFFASNIKLQLSNSLYTFTDNNGSFAVTTGNLGQYKLTTISPYYYKPMPDSSSYTFTSYDTSVSTSIALQPIANVDSLHIAIGSYFEARPGFPFYYKVNYINTGSTTLSPDISIDYNAQLLTFDSSSNSLITGTGSPLHLHIANLKAGEQGSFIVYFTVNTFASSGTHFNGTASISTNAINLTNSISNVIVASLDPNDKQATPQLTPHEVSIGKPINYTIHFQNIGDASAVNIYIVDTLSSLLDANSLQVNSSSHLCKTTINGNLVTFEFSNIFLPGSYNEPASHGFVSFSVKPQSTLSSGSIDNTAAIYFDYNSPVVTNTASTLISDGTVPLQLLSFSGSMQTVSNTVLLRWNTANEFNTNYFTVEQSADRMHFTEIKNLTAKGIGDNSYNYSVPAKDAVMYYRIKITDKDGHYIYSNIVEIKYIADNNDLIVLNNPVTNTLFIKTNAYSLINTKAVIVTSKGEEVKRIILQQGIQRINVNELAAGVYYIKAGTGIKKIIINH